MPDSFRLLVLIVFGYQKQRRRQETSHFGKHFGSGLDLIHRKGKHGRKNCNERVFRGRGYGAGYSAGYGYGAGYGLRQNVTEKEFLQEQKEFLESQLELIDNELEDLKD